MGSTGDSKLKCCRMEAKNRNSSMRARPSPTHTRFPGGDSNTKTPPWATQQGQSWVGGGCASTATLSRVDPRLSVEREPRVDFSVRVSATGVLRDQPSHSFNHQDSAA